MISAIHVIVAFISGVAVTLQGQFMGVMDRTIGTKESVFITYGSGGLIVALAMLISRGGNLKAAAGVPKYALTAGVLGLIIVASIGYVVPRIGVARAFTLIVASQFFVASLIDHFGLFSAEIRPIDGTKLSGLALMLAGVWLVVR